MVLSFNKPPKYGNPIKLRKDLTLENIFSEEIINQILSDEFLGVHKQRSKLEGLLKKVSEKIFFSLTNKAIKDYARVIFLEPKKYDHLLYNILVSNGENSKDVLDYLDMSDGFNMAYVTVLKDKRGDIYKFWNLMHELGHIIYPGLGDPGELASFYFQELAIRKLSLEIGKNITIELGKKRNQKNCEIRDKSIELINKGLSPENIFGDYSTYTYNYLRKYDEQLSKGITLNMLD